MPNFCSNVSLYCFLNTAVGGPPATIFASFFAASTVFFHSSCDSAAYTIAAQRSTVRTNELHMNGRLTTDPWVLSNFSFFATVLLQRSRVWMEQARTKFKSLNLDGYPCTQRSMSISYPLSCEMSKGSRSGSKPRYSAIGRLLGR